VSGGAFGIDAAAHEGAVKGGGASVAVMGTGIDTFYPSSHRALYERILEAGLAVSQFPAGTGSYPGNFPLRNPTIAALSQVVVVIEAPGQSGALRTASAAAELGREVMVVPGPISSFGFAGSHALIRDGAILVDHPRQVMEALGIEEDAGPAAAPSLLSEPQRRILDFLTEAPQSSEKIANGTGLGDDDVLVELTMLEIEGLILRHSAGYARKP
jgi:DNA processing protein